MNDYPAINDVISCLKNFPNIPITQKDNTICVEAKDDNGFRVELIDNSKEFTLYCDGWFDDQLIDFKEAARIFVGSLTTAARLCVREKNQKRYWFVLEFYLKSQWRSFRLSTFYPKFYSFWKKKREYYLQNDWIDIDKFKPWIGEHLTGEKIEKMSKEN